MYAKWEKKKKKLYLELAFSELKMFTAYPVNNISKNNWFNNNFEAIPFTSNAGDCNKKCISLCYYIQNSKNIAS